MPRLPTSRLLIAGIAAMIATGGAAQVANNVEVAPAAAVSTIARYPHGHFLENLSALPDGGILVTSYIDGRILRWAGAGAPATFASLSVHPVGILAERDRIIISAHGASFMDGPAFVQTNRMLVLDRAGKVTRETALPDARFLNGLAALGPDHVLVADSIAGVIWLYRPSTGASTAWLQAPELAPDPRAIDQRPGANGIKLHEGWLYVSNSSRGALYRIKVVGRGHIGALAVFARTGPIDDFAFLADGAIAAATHGARLIRIDALGRVSDILASGCDSCTSVAALPDGDLIVTTSGNLLEGGKAEARLLRVALPRPR